jgi:hypothetical protein
VSSGRGLNFIVSSRTRKIRFFNQLEQAEWRVILWRRLGATVFGGVGEVARRSSGYDAENLCPVEEQVCGTTCRSNGELISVLDLAYSKTGGSWSMGVGEVF